MFLIFLWTQYFLLRVAKILAESFLNEYYKKLLKSQNIVPHILTKLFDFKGG